MADLNWGAAGDIFDAGKGHEKYSKELKALAPQAQQFSDVQWARAMQALNQAMAQMQGGSGNTFAAIYGGQPQSPIDLDAARAASYQQILGPKPQVELSPYSPGSPGPKTSPAKTPVKAPL